MKEKLTIVKRRHIVEVMETLDELLDDWRRKNGYSHADACEACDISASLWSRIMARQRIQLRPATFLKLSHGTGYTIDTLMAAAARSLVAEAAITA